MATIHYNDVMADLAATLELAGTRKFLSDFQRFYPKHWHDIATQIGHVEKPLPRLLDKNYPAVEDDEGSGYAAPV